MLKSGRVLAGRVTSTEKIHGKTFLVVDTPFGELRIGDRYVSKRVEQPAAPDATVRMRRLRVVRIEGRVERKPTGGTEWFPVRWKDAYDKTIVNADNAIIRPGDTIRTGRDGMLDFQPRKDIWIRVGRESLVEVPAVDADKAPSLELRRGKTLVDVEGRARGGTFRVRTPITTLATRDGRFEAGEKGAKVLRGSVQGEADTLTKDGARTYAYGKPIQRLPKDDMCFVPAGRYRFGGKQVTGLGNILGDAPQHSGKPDPLTTRLYFCSAFRHRIDQAFLVDRRETTNAQYRAWFTARGRKAPIPDSYSDLHPYANANTPTMAMELLAWLGKHLPRETEWEAAARGPKGRRLPWGQSLAPLSGSGVFVHPGPVVRTGNRGNSYPDSEQAWNLERLLPVTEPTPDVSAFGVEALITGVAEWTASRVGNPVFRAHRRTPVHPSHDDHWVMRGVMLQSMIRVRVEGGAEAHVLRWSGMRGVVRLPD